MTELIQHHTHYIEIHGFDKIVEMSRSEHNKLNHRDLFPEVTKEELYEISTKAHHRTEKSKVVDVKYRQSENRNASARKYEKSLRGKARRAKCEAHRHTLTFSEYLDSGVRFAEQIYYNENTGSVGYCARFRVSKGHVLLAINIGIN